MFPIAFDLVVAEAIAHHPRGVTAAYNDIGAVLRKFDFERIQGSVCDQERRHGEPLRGPAGVEGVAFVPAGRAGHSRIPDRKLERLHADHQRHGGIGPQRQLLESHWLGDQRRPRLHRGGTNTSYTLTVTATTLQQRKTTKFGANAGNALNRNVGEISNPAREDGRRWRDGAEQKAQLSRETARHLASLARARLEISPTLPAASQSLSGYLCEMVARGSSSRRGSWSAQISMSRAEEDRMVR